jgi:hypothetical protein
LQLSAQRGPRLHPHPHLLPLQHLHLLLLHLRLLLHQHPHLSLLLLLLRRPHLLLRQQAKPTNCFRQLSDDWLPSTKSISMH